LDFSCNHVVISHVLMQQNVCRTKSAPCLHLRKILPFEQRNKQSAKQQVQLKVSTASFHACIWSFSEIFNIAKFEGKLTQIPAVSVWVQRQIVLLEKKLSVARKMLNQKSSETLFKKFTSLWRDDQQDSVFFSIRITHLSFITALSYERAKSRRCLTKNFITLRHRTPLGYFCTYKRVINV